MLPSSWHAPGMMLCCTAVSSNRPRHVVHQQHRTGLCSSMAGVQHTHHHHPASAACGVQDWEYTLRTIAVDSEDRVGDGDTLQGTHRVPVKLRMESRTWGPMCGEVIAILVNVDL